MHQYISPRSRATQKRPVSKSISTCENTPDSAWLSGVGVEGLRVKALQSLAHDPTQQAARLQSMTRLLLDYLLYNYEVQFFPLHRMQLPDLKLLGKSLSLKDKIKNENDFIKVDESFKEMNKAIDRFRELYMLERIKYAQAKNYILVGMGEIHLKNLTPQLAQLGIRPELMDSFLARQRREQEVRKRQSQRRRPIHTS